MYKRIIYSYFVAHEHVTQLRPHLLFCIAFTFMQIWIQPETKESP